MDFPDSGFAENLAHIVFFHFFKNQEYSENKIFSEVIDPSESEYEH